MFTVRLAAPVEIELIVDFQFRMADESEGLALDRATRRLQKLREGRDRLGLTQIRVEQHDLLSEVPVSVVDQILMKSFETTKVTRNPL